VTTVDAAISVRESGLATELAVAGWYQAPQPMYCPFVGLVAVPLLEGDCTLDQTWLMANPESLVHVAQATAGVDGTEISGHPPAGPAVNVAFAGPSMIATEPLPIDGDSTPTPAVFIGHFHDGRASLCSTENAAACQRRFVVDAIAWVDGSPQTVPTLVDWRGGGAPSETQAQLDAVTAFLESRLWVLNTMLIPGSEIGRLEPSLARSDRADAVILSNEPLVWLATAVDTYDQPLGNVARTYVIDSEGRLYADAGGVAFIRVLPR
jgi:hypothetical protein